MLDLKNIKEIKTELTIKKNSINFPKKNNFDFPENYRTLVSMIKTVEISAECILYDSVKSVNETKEFSDSDYWSDKFDSDKIKEYWFFGANGQGDLWILHKNDNVFFYDHNKGELSKENLIDLGVNFDKWLQFAFLNKEFEELDYGGILTQELKKKYKVKLSELSTTFVENYPFEI